MRIHELIDFENFEYRWDIIEKIPQFAKLKNCLQNPVWHGEGDAFTHTRMVCEEALKCLDCLNSNEKKILMTAALFHDIGKGETASQGKDGRWHAYGHEFESERIARLLLWDEGWAFREAVCALVRWHMEPLKLFESKDTLERIVHISKRVPSWELLYFLKLCDINGSVQKDVQSQEIDRCKLVELRSMAKEMQCYYGDSRMRERGNYG